MFVYIQDENGRKAHYRKQGIYCFDFVNDKALATDLTEQEVSKILEHADYYLKQYGALKIGSEG